MQKKPLKITILITILACALYFSAAETAAKKENPDFKVIIGEWVRPDGGYIIRVRDVNLDGSIDVEYTLTLH